MEQIAAQYLPNVKKEQAFTVVEVAVECGQISLPADGGTTDSRSCRLAQLSGMTLEVDEEGNVIILFLYPTLRAEDGHDDIPFPWNLPVAIRKLPKVEVLYLFMCNSIPQGVSSFMSKLDHLIIAPKIPHVFGEMHPVDFHGLRATTMPAHRHDVYSWVEASTFPSLRKLTLNFESYPEVVNMLTAFCRRSTTLRKLTLCGFNFDETSFQNLLLEVLPNHVPGLRHLKVNASLILSLQPIAARLKSGRDVSPAFCHLLRNTAVLELTGANDDEGLLSDPNEKKLW